MSLTTTRELLLPILAKHLDLSQTTVFVFGSQVTGPDHPKADLDIGLESDQPVDPVTLSNLREELEQVPLLIDVVDFATVSDSFKQVAQKEIIIWHQPSSTSSTNS